MIVYQANRLHVSFSGINYSRYKIVFHIIIFTSLTNIYYFFGDFEIIYLFPFVYYIIYSDMNYCCFGLHFGQCRFPGNAFNFVLPFFFSTDLLNSFIFMDFAILSLNIIILLFVILEEMVSFDFLVSLRK